jgi:hypothetical protein
MKIIMSIILTAVFILSAETLFEVKDASNKKVLDVSADGMRVYNLGDTLMVISATAIKAYIDNSKALSRTFAVTTTASKASGPNVFEVNTQSVNMKDGLGGEKYSDLSPVNIFMGLNAGTNTTPSGFYGNSNVFIGNSAGFTNTLGQKNIFIGNRSGYTNSEGDYNVFLGHNAGMLNTTGDRNVFIGYESGQANTIGTANTFVGEASGTRNIDGFANSFYGRNAGSENTYGDYNTNVGYEAANSCTSGNNNSVYGAESGRNNQTGSSNSIFGYQSARGAFGNSFSNNTIMGCQSGYSNTTGSNNTYLGYQSGYSNLTGARNVFLGYMAGYNETGSDKLYIDNSSTTNPLIWGDFDMNWIKINGDFDVLNLATVGGLDVNSNAVVDGTFKVGTGATISRFSTDGTMAANSDSYVPTERAVRTYVTANKDNLGNHTATQNIRLSGYYLSNDGGNEGVYVDTDGDVGIGTSTPGSNRLRVLNNASGIAGATGYFENSNSLGIGMAVYATSTDAALYVEQKNTTSSGYIAKFASQYGGLWRERFNIANTGALFAPYLASGTGTALYLTSGNEIVKLSSSKRYKKDIAPLSVDMKKFMSLQPVSFKWNEKSATEGKADNGLIAEEVEKIDPALAVYNDKGEIEGVDYQKINIMLLKVVQDQERKIEELEKRIGKLEGK